MNISLNQELIESINYLDNKAAFKMLLSIQSIDLWEFQADIMGDIASNMPPIMITRDYLLNIVSEYIEKNGPYSFLEYFENYEYYL
jgi:uncharacterized protein YozE (UPF0346 family)